jgi:hypothetical protein
MVGEAPAGARAYRKRARLDLSRFEENFTTEDTEDPLPTEFTTGGMATINYTNL